VLLAFASCEQGPAQGDMAPDFEATSLQKQTESLSKYRGKLVLLHFWADWCESCRKEFPLMQAYYKDLAGPEFELIAINVKQPQHISLSFQQEFATTFPMICDEQGTLSEKYGITQFPTNYLVSPEGKIARKVNGWVDKEFVENVLHNIRREKAK
jgi:peroxiredoxin